MTILLSYHFLKSLGTIKNVTIFLHLCKMLFVSVETTNKMAANCSSAILGGQYLVGLQQGLLGLLGLSRNVEECWLPLACPKLCRMPGSG